ncbi:MAG: sigma-70 family RNA polymerase sigma factor [Verrucomicrobiales bacterium]|nr:sigma-70 family RNA polymerase sigma factor [Verrucomicrobiales bacterium]
MVTRDPNPDPAPAPAGCFATTHWSVVLAAGHGSETAAGQALETLCQTYWYPIYAYVRRRGYRVEDAQDLTQEFFAMLLRRNDFSRPDPSRGRFRSFLLTALNHFLTSDWQHRHTQRRGGGYAFRSWDHAEAERRYATEPESALTPEKLFERRWAAALLEQVMARLQAECRANGKIDVFEALKDSLWGQRTSPGYAELARRWDTTDDAIRAMAYRLRQRYRALIHAEIAQTVSSPEEIEAEVRNLVHALSES